MGYKRGSLFHATETMAVSGLIYWNAPTTTGFEGVLSKGTVLVKLNDDIAGMNGGSYLPTELERYEKDFVPEMERSNEKYAGYAIVLKNEDIGVRVLPLKNGLGLLKQWGIRAMQKRSLLHRLIWGGA